MSEELQAPMCENYPWTEVLILWPSGKVQRFPSLAKAKTMLMRQHFQYIVCNPKEARVLADDNVSMVDAWKLDDTIQTDEELWDYLVDISEERDPWSKAADIPDSNRMSKRVTAAGYTINHAKCGEDIKLPKQAKIIAKSFLETFEDGSAVTDDDIERHMKHLVLSGTLSTKQEPMRIFTYYRKALLEKQCLKLRG